MPSRVDLVHRLAALVGPMLEVEDVQNGWPALVSVGLGDNQIRLALYIGEVHGTHRDRRSERRFQNPGQGKAITEVAGRTTLLIGVWTHDEDASVRAPVLVLPESTRRIGRDTRWSLFVSVRTLIAAGIQGWATQITTSGEQLVCFQPGLLPLAVAALVAGVFPDEREVQTAVVLSLPSRDDPPWVDDPARASRIRRAVEALVRDARFSGRVLDAYDRRCAMCALGLNLVQGAHIYPASAPGSRDRPANGLALCANHHLAFDRHQIAVTPSTLRVLVRPDVIERAHDDPVARAFVESTLPVLREARAGAEPDPKMLALRYEYFADKYAWVSNWQ